jgi:hypothetical protein
VYCFRTRNGSPAGNAKIASTHTATGKRFIVRANELLTAFLSLERDAMTAKGANGNGDIIPRLQQIKLDTSERWRASFDQINLIERG